MAIGEGSMEVEARIAYIDVFSRAPYGGNPVAVVASPDDLGVDTMQQIARWTNLSETVFLLSATSEAADYRVRIFTPTSELPFAGHPTLGAAHAWLDWGGKARADGTIVQECAAGLISIRLGAGVLFFAAPEVLRTGPLDAAELARLREGLGIAADQVIGHQWVDNGPGWAVIRLRSAAEVLAVEPRLACIPDAMVGVIGAYPPGSAHAFEIRAFAPRIQVPEDPVTGSVNASVAQWLVGTGFVPDQYSVAQGARVGRSGEVCVRVDRGEVWIGGHTATRFQGMALL